MADGITFENIHWLQVFLDHAIFLSDSFAKTETQWIERAENFKKIAAGELLRPGQDHQAKLKFATDFKQYKLSLINSLLLMTVKFHMDVTLVNHMVNEIDQYITILNIFIETGKIYEGHVLEHHRLWLLDAEGHAVAMIKGLDPVEKATMKEFKDLKKRFHNLYCKTLEFIGYTRSGRKEFPALTLLNNEAYFEEVAFINLQKELLSLIASKAVLSNIQPRFIDHMLREESYYLAKISKYIKDAPALPYDPIGTPI